MAGSVINGYGDSLSGHSHLNHFTRYIIEGTLNIRKSPISESFYIQLVLNQVHRIAQSFHTRASTPVSMLITVLRFHCQDLVTNASIYEPFQRF